MELHSIVWTPTFGELRCVVNFYSRPVDFSRYDSLGIDRVHVTSPNFRDSWINIDYSWIGANEYEGRLSADLVVEKGLVEIANNISRQRELQGIVHTVLMSAIERGAGLRMNQHKNI